MQYLVADEKYWTFIQINAFQEAEASYRSQIKNLEQEVEHHKKLLAERTRLFKREQELMLSAIHVVEMTQIRQQVGSLQPPKSTPTPWLPLLRNTVSSENGLWFLGELTTSTQRGHVLKR